MHFTTPYIFIFCCKFVLNPEPVYDLLLTLQCLSNCLNYCSLRIAGVRNKPVERPEACVWIREKPVVMQKLEKPGTASWMLEDSPATCTAKNCHPNLKVICRNKLQLTWYLNKKKNVVERKSELFVQTSENEKIPAGIILMLNDTHN